MRTASTTIRHRHQHDPVPKTYTLDTAVLVETVTGLEGTELTFAANEEKALTAQEVQVSYTGSTGRQRNRPGGGDGFLYGHWFP